MASTTSSGAAASSGTPCVSLHSSMSPRRVRLGNSCALRSSLPVFGQVPPVRRVDPSRHVRAIERGAARGHAPAHATTGSCMMWRPTGQRKSSGTGVPSHRGPIGGASAELAPALGFVRMFNGPDPTRRARILRALGRRSVLDSIDERHLELVRIPSASYRPTVRIVRVRRGAHGPERLRADAEVDVVPDFLTPDASQCATEWRRRRARSSAPCTPRVHPRCTRRRRPTLSKSSSRYDSYRRPESGVRGNFTVSSITTRCRERDGSETGQEAVSAQRAKRSDSFRL